MMRYGTARYCTVCPSVSYCAGTVQCCSMPVLNFIERGRLGSFGESWGISATFPQAEHETWTWLQLLLSCRLQEPPKHALADEGGGVGDGEKNTLASDTETLSFPAKKEKRLASDLAYFPMAFRSRVRYDGTMSAAVHLPPRRGQNACLTGASRVAQGYG